MSKKLTVIFLVIIIAIVNYAIYKKEQIIQNGEKIYLKIAPKDPRSLMQGDYMALNFEISRDIQKALKKEQKDIYMLKNQDGFVVAKVAKNRVARFEKLYKSNEKLSKDEIKLKYKVRNNHIKFATNAYFFEEGNSKKYQNAKYGEFRVSKDGELLLVNLINDLTTLK
jgi:uncharacterized membrane-anchored protein